MARGLRYVVPAAPAARVAQIMSEYNLLALPVINAQGRLPGIGSGDDALETILQASLRRHIPACLARMARPLACPPPEGPAGLAPSSGL